MKYNQGVSESDPRHISFSFMDYSVIFVTILLLDIVYAARNC